MKSNSSQVLKARKNAKILAVALILIGTFILISSISIYVKQIRHFDVIFSNITNDERAQRIISDLASGYNVVVTGILPTCSLAMIISGYYTLLYLRKERIQTESRDEKL